jgi:hypothetical protein
MLPSIAQGDANKLWIVPSEIGDALKGLGSAVGQVAGITQKAEGSWQAPELDNGHAPEIEGVPAVAPDAAVAEADNAVAEAIAAAQKAAVSTRGEQTPPTTLPTTPPVSPNSEPPAAEPPQDR